MQKRPLTKLNKIVLKLKKQTALQAKLLMLLKLNVSKEKLKRKHDRPPKLNV